MYKGMEVNFSKPKHLPEIDIKSQFNITSPMLQSTKGKNYKFEEYFMIFFTECM